MTVREIVRRWEIKRAIHSRLGAQDRHELYPEQRWAPGVLPRPLFRDKAGFLQLIGEVIEIGDM